LAAKTGVFRDGATGAALRWPLDSLLPGAPDRGGTEMVLRRKLAAWVPLSWVRIEWSCFSFRCRSFGCYRGSGGYGLCPERGKSAPTSGCYPRLASLGAARCFEWHPGNEGCGTKDVGADSISALCLPKTPGQRKRKQKDRASLNSPGRAFPQGPNREAS
jgi:hypothetical protein